MGLFSFRKINRHKSAVYRASVGRRPLNRKLRFWLSILLIVVILVVLHQCYKTILAKHQKHPAQPVVVATVTSRDVPVYLSGLGGVTPITSVTVKTTINGVMTDVYFKEGQMVKAGQLLALVDPRPYEAQLLQYQGQLERDKALLANAKLDLQRYKTLWRQDSVSKQIYDTQVALVKQDEGTVKMDEGLIAVAKVNLVYCHLTSPVDGRVGLRLVDPGNVVQISDTTGIAVIDTLSPIDTVFTIPEDAIPQVLEQIDAGKTLTVDAYDRAQNQLLSTGTLLTMDNQVDPTTGTVKLKAQFQNADQHLFPNQFVNVKLQIKTLPNATVVPTAAIQYGVKGPFIYVMNADDTVSAKPVVVGVAINSETTINSGVSPGQAVVVQGADKLTDGANVMVASDNDPTGSARKSRANRHTA